jgi:hypothetical protein
VERWSPALSQNVGEGFQQDCSDDGIVLWPDAIVDMPLAQAFEALVNTSGFLRFWITRASAPNSFLRCSFISVEAKKALVWGKRVKSRS